MKATDGGGGGGGGNDGGSGGGSDSGGSAGLGVCRRVLLDAGRLPPPGKRTVLELQGHSIAIFGTPDGWHALADSCPHQGASLAGGRVEGGAVQCPAHGLRFDLVTGCLRNAPALKAVVYPLEPHPDGMLIVLPGKE